MKPAIAAVIALLVILSAFPAEAAKVDRVVAVTTAHDSLPPLVAERMNHSVAAIASQLLEGKEIAAVQAGNAGYAGLIHEVFDKVLVGYTVKQVRIQPAAETRWRWNCFLGRRSSSPCRWKLLSRECHIV